MAKSELNVNEQINMKEKMVDFLRIYTNYDAVKKYVTTHEKHVIPLSWPSGYNLIVSNWIGDELMEDWIENWNNLLCCFENLQIFGYVTKSEREPLEDDYRVLVGQGGKFYGILPSVKDEICRLGDCPDSFIKRGMKRYQRFLCSLPEDEIDIMLDITKDEDLYDIIICPEKILRFLEDGKEATFNIKVLQDETMKFHKKQDEFLCKNSNTDFIQTCKCIGSFGSITYENSGRISVYMNLETGAIFAYNDNIGKAVFLAMTYDDFLKVGPKAYYVNYTFYKDKLFSADVICPHSPIFEGKIKMYTEKDLLLKEFMKQDSYCDNEDYLYDFSV